MKRFFSSTPIFKRDENNQPKMKDHWKCPYNHDQFNYLSKITKHINKYKHHQYRNRNDKQSVNKLNNHRPRMNPLHILTSSIVLY